MDIGGSLARTPDGLTPADALNADLYPDLIEAGGLAAALRQVAHAEHLDLGEIKVQNEWGRSAFTTARLTADRGAMAVLLGGDSHRFSISAGQPFRDPGWVSGSTPDLAEAVRMLAAWRTGVKLRELTARFPFLEYPPISQGYEDGTPVPAQWKIVLTDQEAETYRDLLTALHADDVTGGMFPYLSMFTLRLAADPYDMSAAEVVVARGPEEGGYRVSSSAAEGERLVRGIGETVEAVRDLSRKP
ncbi:hypothetical protein ABIA31_001340 [Catenulispora sp. MAP5-51]|uniref:hypothetical protein n=1 Tax=Catenulispora sp. MAP5-51 TaxID=3156298 RepID=UPI0035198C1E